MTTTSASRVHSYFDTTPKAITEGYYYRTPDSVDLRRRASVGEFCDLSMVPTATLPLQKAVAHCSINGPEYCNRLDKLVATHHDYLWGAPFTVILASGCQTIVRYPVSLAVDSFLLNTTLVDATESFEIPSTFGVLLPSPRVLDLVTSCPASTEIMHSLGSWPIEVVMTPLEHIPDRSKAIDEMLMAGREVAEKYADLIEDEDYEYTDPSSML